jgi:o-succinylbenzoate---CoA ligase
MTGAQLVTPFYLEPAGFSVDWESSRTLVLANPEWARRDSTAGAIVRLLPELDAHVWVSTSGTSGSSPGKTRWVALSKAAFLASARAVNVHLEATASDVWAHALPLFHVGGLGILARAHLSGARVVPAIETRWDPAAFCERVGASGATLSALVPSQIHDLVHARLASPASLRAIVVGGARLEPPLYRAAAQLGWRCLPSYGLTETCSQVATASLASMALPRYPDALPVLSHAELSADEEGRLSIRAASLLTCYADLEDSATRVRDPKQGGWLPTEDLGRVAGGAVEVLGRATDSVKVLGEMVSLTSVEARAWQWAEGRGLRGAAGFDLAVVAVPDDRLGHEIVLAIAGGAGVCPSGPDLEASIGSFCRDVLLPFERIRRIAMVDEIPRTPLGKAKRQLLAEVVGRRDG